MRPARFFFALLFGAAVLITFLKLVFFAVMALAVLGTLFFAVRAIGFLAAWRGHSQAGFPPFADPRFGHGRDYPPVSLGHYANPQHFQSPSFQPSENQTIRRHIEVL